MGDVLIATHIVTDPNDTLPAGGVPRLLDRPVGQPMTKEPRSVEAFVMLLGPCRCQGCGRPVWWNTFAWQDRFRNGMLRTHRCGLQ